MVPRSFSSSPCQTIPKKDVPRWAIYSVETSAEWYIITREDFLTVVSSM